MPRFTPFFLPMRQGNRFCILHSPERGESRGALLFVHPFAEEMNRCRRMAALQSRAFSAAGWHVLQIDLYGCGDSAGEFGEATWDQWVEDVAEGVRWLQRETAHAPVLWGLRAGCLLASQAASAMSSASRLLLWQPVISGRQFLQQVLRLKLGSQIVGSSPDSRMTVAQLRDELAKGRSVEVTGYEISPELASGLEGAELPATDGDVSVSWLEVTASEEPELSPASRGRIEKWQSSGAKVVAQAVKGPLFWQTLEITECPTLIEASLAATRAW